VNAFERKASTSKEWRAQSEKNTQKRVNLSVVIAQEGQTHAGQKETPGRGSAKNKGLKDPILPTRMHRKRVAPLPEE